MPFSSGTYSLPTNSFAQPVAQTTISSTDATATWADFVTAFSTCLLKDGTQTVTANIPMSGFKFTGLGAGSTAGDSLRYQQVFTTGTLALLGPVSCPSTLTAGGTLTALAALNETQATTIAAATTMAVGAIAGNYVKVSGTTAVVSLDSVQAGARRIVEFDGALTFTHNATNLILPGAANITTAAGDTATMVSEGSGNWRCVTYQRAAGVPTAVTTGTTASTFTFNGSGGSSGSITMTWQKMGNWVTINLPSVTATTGTGSTILSSDTALAAAVRPTTQQDVHGPLLTNNGAAIGGAAVVRVTTGGIVQILRDGTASAFTNSAAAGTSTNSSITYFIG